MLEYFSIQECLSAFIVLFAVIDIIGSVPIILTLKEQGREVSPSKASLYSLALLVGFYFAGDMVLHLFQVDIASFALAGSVVIFLVALEMIIDIEIFKNQGPIQSATLVPLVFPLIAGAGAFTTLLSLKSAYNTVNIILALLANTLVVYLVLKSTDKIERLIGKGGLYVLRKFFGIILLAIAVRLFTTNLSQLLHSVG